MKHNVKSWSHFFQAIKKGDKLHDLRKMDRDYNVGDILVLEEYDFINGAYTGDSIEVEISYITSNKVPCAFSSSALAKDYAILSLRKLPISVTIKASDFKIDKAFKDSWMMNGNRRIVLEADQFVVGEKSSEQTVRVNPSEQTVRVNPVTPNPNAEFYQNVR